MKALVSAPAMAGVESKHEFKGTDEDYSKDVLARVGYETIALTPYIEGGFGVTYPEDEETTFTALKLVAN